MAGKDKEGENIVITGDSLVLSSGGGKHGDSNIVIKDGKKCTCCHVEHVEHWDAWIPQHNGWNGWSGWKSHHKEHEHWKK